MTITTAVTAPPACRSCRCPLDEEKRRDARYCSDACRMRHYRRRKDAALTLAELRAREAVLLAQIERDEGIAYEHYQLHRAQGMNAPPDLRLPRCYGPGYPAYGRLWQARRRLRRVQARLAAWAPIGDGPGTKRDPAGHPSAATGLVAA